MKGLSPFISGFFSRPSTIEAQVQDTLTAAIHAISVHPDQTGSVPLYHPFRSVWDQLIQQFSNARSYFDNLNQNGQDEQLSMLSQNVITLVYRVIGLNKGDIDQVMPDLFNHIGKSFHLQFCAWYRVSESADGFRMGLQNRWQAFEISDQDLLDQLPTVLTHLPFDRAEILDSHYLETSTRLSMTMSQAVQTQFDAILKQAQIHSLLVIPIKIQQRVERVLVFGARIPVDSQYAWYPRLVTALKEIGLILWQYLDYQFRITESEARHNAQHSELVSIIQQMDLTLAELVHLRVWDQQVHKADHLFVFSLKQKLIHYLEKIDASAQKIRYALAGSSTEEASQMLSNSYRIRDILEQLTDLIDQEAVRHDKLQSFQIEKVFLQLVSVYNVEAIQTGRTIKTLIATGIPQWVRGDNQRLRIILGNLLQSGLQSPVSQNIVLSCEIVKALAKSCLIRFCVSYEIDSEPGLASDIVNHDPQLRIANEMVEQFDGHLRCHFPRSGIIEFQVQLQFDYGQIKESNEPAIIPDLSGFHILVVEDYPGTQASLQQLLEHWGAQVSIAANGAIAIDFLQHTAVDLVLSDIEMPVMNGFQMAGILRNTLHLVTLPALAMSANILQKDQEKCIQAGFDAYIDKPLDTNELGALLLRYIPEHVRGGTV